MQLTLPPGTIVASGQRDYIIEKVLGQGGFGITYLANTEVETTAVVQDPFGTQKQTTRQRIQVALKEFFMKDVNGRDGFTVTTSQGNATFRKYFDKFATEADNLKRLDHPNIVKVLERFQANGTQYYSMQLIEGETLDAYIERNGGVSVDKATKIIHKVAHSLQFMHSQRMLHLDLKPKNIMLKPNGDVIIIDFGLSKQYDESGNPESSTTIGAGTPGFSPVEQASYHGGRDFPVTLDVYALGATFYKLITGQTPPLAADVLNNGLPVHLLKQKGTPQPLIQLIVDAMHPMRKQRIQTVLAFLQRLPETVGDADAIEVEIETAFGETQPMQGLNNLSSEQTYPASQSDKLRLISVSNSSKSVNTNSKFPYRNVFVLLLVVVFFVVFIFMQKCHEEQLSQQLMNQKYETAESLTAVATLGENGYVAYDNKKGYTVDIPNGLFKYKNKILDEKDGEEGLLQYTQEADNNMTNILSVNYDEFDSLTPEQVKKDFEEWKGNQKDNNPTFIKEEVNADNWTLIFEYKNSIGDKEYRALKRFYNFEKKATALIEFEYMDSGKAKFTDEIINHVFDSFKFK